MSCTATACRPSCGISRCRWSLPPSPATTGRWAVAQFLIENAYSREAEAEADDTGVAILERAGLRADGLAAFFAKLQKDHDDSEMRYIGTHPPLADRRAKIARGQQGGTVLSPTTGQHSSRSARASRAHFRETATGPT